MYSVGIWCTFFGERVTQLKNASFSGWICCKSCHKWCVCWMADQLLLTTNPAATSKPLSVDSIEDDKQKIWNQLDEVCDLNTYTQLLTVKICVHYTFVIDHFVLVYAVNFFCILVLILLGYTFMRSFLHYRWTLVWCRRFHQFVKNHHMTGNMVTNKWLGLTQITPLYTDSTDYQPDHLCWAVSVY